MAGETTRGWIPEFLPKSSRSIRLVEELSPSKEWCAFDFVPAGSQSFREALTKAQPPAPVRHVPSPGVSWWPAILTGDLDVNSIHNAGLDLYVVVRPATSVSNGFILFAINWHDGRAFFYSH